MNTYMAVEEDIIRTISDFSVFCNYIKENKTILTKTREEIGKKDCFLINSRLSKPIEISGPNYMQQTYQTINLFFHISLHSGIIKRQNDNKGKIILNVSDEFDKYNELNIFAKYIFLFKTYWVKLDHEELYSDSILMSDYSNIVAEAFIFLKDAKPGVRIFADLENIHMGYDNTNPVHRLFIGEGPIVSHLRDFGFWEYEDANIPDFRKTKKDIYVKSITPTAFGIAMINACIKRPFELYNEQNTIEDNFTLQMDDSFLPSTKRIDSGKLGNIEEIFEKAFENFFPKDSLTPLANATLSINPGKSIEDGEKGNVYIIKVSLDKKVWRRIRVSAAHTLYHLHEAILSSFEFSNEHLYAFFMDGKAWSNNAYWSREDEHPPYADKAVIGRIGLSPGKKFLYLYDFGDEWKFSIKVEDILKSKIPPVRPMVIESHGQSPEQYPDF